MNKQVSILFCQQVNAQGNVTSQHHGQWALQNSTTDSLESSGLPQTAQHFLVSDKLCSMFQKHIQGGLLSLFSSENISVQGTERILCNNVFPWATVTVARLGMVYYEGCVAPFCFVLLALGLFKSDTRILLFPPHMQHADKQCGIIFNPILKFYRKYFFKLPFLIEAAWQM